MTAKEILEKLNTRDYIIEHSVEEEKGNNIIIGAISKKSNPSGFGRREFVLREKSEQEEFIQGYQEYLASIMG